MARVSLAPLMSMGEEHWDILGGDVREMSRKRLAQPQPFEVVLSKGKSEKSAIRGYKNNSGDLDRDSVAANFALNYVK